MSRRYPKKRGRGAARDAARQLRELYHGRETRVGDSLAGNAADDDSVDGQARQPGSDRLWGEAEAILNEDRRRVRVPRGQADGAEVEPVLDPDAARTEGRVIGAASGRCLVETDGEVVDAFLPSRLAAEQRERIAVGDRVTLVQAQSPAGREGMPESREATWWVHGVAPRATELSRPDPHHPHRRRVLAANVDVVVHVASIHKPPLVPALLDRFRIVIGESGAEPLVVINKIDLASPVPKAGRIEGPIDDDADPEIAQLEPYRALGLGIVLCSAERESGMDDLRDCLRGKTAVLAGHSGVGKSSLLNALAGRRLATTGDVGGRGAGRHTTTRAALVHLPDDIALIDTPGIRELGLWHLEPRELDRHFEDIATLADDCKFRDCSHLHEPRCAVRAAVASGTLDPGRLQTYHRIRQSLE